MLRLISLILSLFFSQYLAGEVTLTAGLPAFPPFAFKNSDEVNVGSVVKYYRLLSEKVDFPIQVVRMPYARMKKSLENGTLDMAVIFRNEELANFVDYVGLVSYSKVVIIPQKNYRIETYEQLLLLDGIAVIRGASFGPRFDNDFQLNKYFVNDYFQGMSMLKLGRVDAVVGSLSGLEYTSSIIEHGAENWGNAFLLKDKEWWLHFSKKSKYKDTHPTIAKAMKELYKPYLIYELYKAENERKRTLQNSIETD